MKICCLVRAIAHIMGQWQVCSNGEWWLAGGNQVGLDKNLLQYHSVHHKSPIKSPRTEPEILLWEATTNYLSSGTACWKSCISKFHLLKLLCSKKTGREIYCTSNPFIKVKDFHKNQSNLSVHFTKLNSFQWNISELWFS